MYILCRLLIWSWFVASWWNEYRRTKRDHAKARGTMALVQRFDGLNHIRLLRRVYMTKCG